MGTPETESASAERRARKRGDRAARNNGVEEARTRVRTTSAPAENAIREGRRRAVASVVKPKRGGQAQLPLEGLGEREAPQTLAAARSVPPEIERRFVRVGREFYFPDGTRAFSEIGRAHV